MSEGVRIIRCCVPFCRRKRRHKEGDGEWICAVHWRTVPPALKAVKFKTHREYRRRFGNTVFWKYPPGSPERIACVEVGRACDASWLECKRAATEIAVGI